MGSKSGIDYFSYILYGTVHSTKLFRRYRLRFEPRHRIYFMHFLPGTTPKLWLFSKQIWTSDLKLSRDTFLLKCNEPTGSGFESQYKLCFLIFFSTKYQNINFFEHQNQLRPLSILSHTGDGAPGLLFQTRTTCKTNKTSLTLAGIRIFIEKVIDYRCKCKTIQYNPKALNLS